MQAAVLATAARERKGWQAHLYVLMAFECHERAAFDTMGSEPLDAAERRQVDDKGRTDDFPT
jgi:hypothetical protein